ncbi:synaptogyrin-like [Pollicipes pollicipes]|uniref:synaptogyrin-like n=1 Tax=Pollicipes pollicipes TaxID=41117 RepID=UPI001884AC1C|nr:synaptogyrin-like [Pollicipes pollicipes]
MMEGGAFGGAKMGAAFDPLTFVQRPQVVLRALCVLFAIIVFGCISSQGWYVNNDGVTTCLYNDNSGACNYGTGIAVIAFLAAIAFLVGEFMFDRMSSVKTRKHYVLADLGFSGFWTFLFFVSFCLLTDSWNKSTNVPVAASKNPVQAAIAFTFFSIFTWGAAAYLAYLRFKQGTGNEFATGYDQEPAAGAGYAGYPGAMDGAPDQSGYQEPPFSQPQDAGQNFQPPAY